MLLGVSVISSASGEKAGAAENGASLRRVKGNSRLLSALRALHGDFDALADTRSLRGGNGCESLVLGLLAGLATFRLVL